MKDFTNSGKPYDPKSRKQLQTKDDIIILCAEAYTPLFIF